MIIFGWRFFWGYRVPGNLYAFCPACKDHVSMEYREGRRWFHVFLIPVFPISGKYHEVYACHRCGAVYKADSLPEERMRRARIGKERRNGHGPYQIT